MISSSCFRSSFNSRPREAGDASLRTAIYIPSSFNSRPREAGDKMHAERRDDRLGFNSRPREAGDRDNLCNYRHSERQIAGQNFNMISFLCTEFINFAKNI